MKRIPKFENEQAEREFWSSHDSTEYVDWSKAQQAVLPNLRPTLRTISIRLPVPMIEELKAQANKRDVAYQALIKMFLAEALKKERSVG